MSPQPSSIDLETVPYICGHRKEGSESQVIWNKTISGTHDDALYVTVMSKDSFADLRGRLPGPERSGSKQLRVLTLDPGLSRSALKTFAKNLAEHQAAPCGAISQVKNAASDWSRLAHDPAYAGFLRVRSYRSSPTVQGILVPGELVLVELLPYGATRTGRPALIIERNKNRDLYEVFATAFEALWRDASPLSLGERVDDNTRYTQAYTELRRYHDYELTAAGWFGALQIGLATVMVRATADIIKVVRASIATQGALVVVILALGFSGVFSVWYTKRRHEQLGDRMKEEFGGAYMWPNLPKSRKITIRCVQIPIELSPVTFILIVLSLLPAVNVLLLRVGLCELPWMWFWVILSLILSVAAPVLVYGLAFRSPGGGNRD